jgi:hypothetical protein
MVGRRRCAEFEEFRSVLWKFKDAMDVPAGQGLSEPNMDRRKGASFRVESGLDCFL